LPLALTAYNHVGIRVRERERSLAFYEKLGFVEVAWQAAPRVSILRNQAGLEINLIVNANVPDGPNVLMDVPEKRAGHTHISFWVDSIRETQAGLAAAEIAIREGPVELGGTEIAVFVRDPDGNVIELAERL
jgi:lactoylglutathione lyase